MDYLLRHNLEDNKGWAYTGVGVLPQDKAMRDSLKEQVGCTAVWKFLSACPPPPPPPPPSCSPEGISPADTRCLRRHRADEFACVKCAAGLHVHGDCSFGVRGVRFGIL